MERDVVRKKKKLANLFDENKKIVDNNQKLLNRKTNRKKLDQNSKKELRNKRRLESYGISKENN